jgi:DNA-binding FrmR family transcriptional regulator
MSGQMSPDTNTALVARLRSAEGHLRSVTSMVETGANCGEVLHQLKAVQGALNAVMREFLSEHLVESEKIIKQSDCPEERSQAMDQLMLLYHWTIDHK